MTQYIDKFILEEQIIKAAVPVAVPVAAAAAAAAEAAAAAGGERTNGVTFYKRDLFLNNYKSDTEGGQSQNWEAQQQQRWQQQ